MDTFEKKYNEALKWMRELYPGLHGATKEDAEHFFPELRESEDERIRKTLVEYFGPQAQLDFIRGVPIQKIRDWLEKQKEPEGLHPEEYPLTPDECIKPIEWSEKDKEMLMRCIAAIPVQGDEIMPTSYLNKLRNWLKFLPERFNLQPKPAEWSDTDKKMLLSIINAFRNGTVSTIEQEQWLKSIPKRFVLQSKQEWSEEDEKMRYFVTEAVQSRYSDRELAKYLDPKIIKEKKQLKQRLFDWLRDLRPHWKPSDEQMEALNALLCIGDFSYVGQATKLQELYIELKKL